MTMREIKQGKMEVTRQFKHASEVMREDSKEVRPGAPRCFETTSAVVKASYGVTLNVGDYNSVRIDAGVELPCYAEEVDSTYAVAWRTVKEEVQKQVTKIKRTK